MDVVTIAEQQYGLITRATAKWVPVFPGVYRIAGAPITKRQRMMAVTLWGGDDAAASHASGAQPLQLSDIRLPGVHLTIPADAGGRLPGVKLHRSTLTRIERANVDDISCTSATRTLVDCAGAADAESLEAAFEAARRMGLTSVEAVARLLEEVVPAPRGCVRSSRTPLNDRRNLGSR
jgi:hypothetical protein